MENYHLWEIAIEVRMNVFSRCQIALTHDENGIF